LEEPPHLIIVINEQDSRHRSSHPSPISSPATIHASCALVAERGNGQVKGMSGGDR
jgi:hypothetical protein